jgi:cobalt/nickel transport system ATP-binding protein
MDVDLIVLDEPTSNLDARGRRSIVEVLRGLSQTLVIASHDLDLVAATCTRCVLLDDGRIVADRPTADLLGDIDLLVAHGVR